MNDTREAFELKISMEYEQPPCIDRDGDGYADGYVDNAWWGWQAAQAEQAKLIGDLVNELSEARDEVMSAMIEAFNLLPYKAHRHESYMEQMERIDMLLNKAKGMV